MRFGLFPFSPVIQGPGNANALPGRSKPLQIGVASGQHGGKARGFLLAAPPFARFFVMPVIAHDFQGAFAVNLLLQPAQGLVHGFAFFKFNLGQSVSLPLRAERAGFGLSSQKFRVRE